MKKIFFFTKIALLNFRSALSLDKLYIIHARLDSNSLIFSCDVPIHIRVATS